MKLKHKNLLSLREVRTANFELVTRASVSNLGLLRAGRPVFTSSRFESLT